MCCALDSSSRYLNAKSGTIRRDDGLCADQSGQDIYRNSCTDQTWQSPEDVKLCVNGTRQGAEDVPITVCNDGSYCCGNTAASESCCQNGLGVWIVNGEETSSNPNGSASSNSAIHTATSSILSSTALASDAASSSPSAINPEPKTNAGAIAGGVVGGVASLAAISGACLYLLFKRRRASSTHLPPNSKWLEIDGKNPVVVAPTYPGDIKRTELPGPAVSLENQRPPSTNYKTAHDLFHSINRRILTRISNLSFESFPYCHPRTRALMIQSSLALGQRWITSA